MARLLVFLLAVFLVAHVSGSQSIYKELYDYVIENSNPLYMPSKKLPIYIAAQSGIVAINNVDREKNELDSNYWLMVSWNTDLKWDPKDYNGIARITVPMSAVWSPDMNMYNTDSAIEFITEPFVGVFANGLHMAAAFVRSTVHCEKLAEDTCSYTYASWGNNNKYLKLKDPSERVFDMNEILKSWKIDSTNYEILTGSYEKTSHKISKSFPDEVDMLKYTFTFKEKNPPRNDPFRALFQWG